MKLQSDIMYKKELQLAESQLLYFMFVFEAGFHTMPASHFGFEFPFLVPLLFERQILLM